MSWVFVLLQEAYAVDTKGRGFTIPVRSPKRVGCFEILWASTNVFECACLLPLQISIYFVTNYMLSMFWYVSILFFMFVFVDASCKDLESRWCQNVKCMQGSFMSKDFMQIFGGNLHSQSFLRLGPLFRGCTLPATNSSHLKIGRNPKGTWYSHRQNYRKKNPTSACPGSNCSGFFYNYLFV